MWEKLLYMALEDASINSVLFCSKQLEHETGRYVLQCGTPEARCSNAAVVQRTRGRIFLLRRALMANAPKSRGQIDTH